ncbi:MAG: hypothetical protein U0R51_02280 [Solirubrobacterales bacterium]
MPRLTYGNVVATIALFVALGGASYAAVKLQKNSVVSKTIKNGQVKNADLAEGAVTGAEVKDGSLMAVDFGESVQGPPGADGQDGAPGADGASLLTALVNGVGSSTTYGTPSGTSTASATEGNVASLSPHATIVARDLSVELTNAPSTGCFSGTCARTFTLRDDGVDTAVSCTVVDTATTCNSGSSTASIAAGSHLSISARVTSGSNSGSPNVRLGWRATTP